MVRVWELSSEALLKGELGTLPLAFIADATPEQIPSLVRRAAKRLARETSRSKEGEMWTAVSVLMGMKFEEEFVAHTLKGIHTMTDSVTYQAILRQGKEMGVREGKEMGVREGEVTGLKKGLAKEARTLLLRLGEKQFGKPNSKTIAEINKIGSVERLEDLAVRVLSVTSWVELLSK